MTNCTRILGTTAALIIAGGATADLQYGEAILSAESTCFTGTDQAQARQKVSLDEMMEVNSFCGGGGTGAYLMADTDWFIMSAGSTVPGHDQ